MNPVAGLQYVSLALLYAAICSPLAGWVVSNVFKWRFAQGLLVSVATLFPVFLGLHPFPDPTLLDCSRGGARSFLQPFHTIGDLYYMVRWRHSLQQWLTSLTVIPPIMNLVLFTLPGLALGTVTGSWKAALGLAVALTLFIETAQITALFGFYACPYRNFDVDDIILNITGTLLGFGVMRMIQFRRTLRLLP